ncbi:TIGR03767 family metallophosphoesterase [Nocardioides litoris]|uniref:TIGR03767 family metallophosphoesterase n=1 Tax=Nocardioides litoris TaxID=1926648 RepID=UPI001121235B|nr:TIGR03767 family metallophosphoesterase [Nocardioides litoris]
MQVTRRGLGRAAALAAAMSTVASSSARSAARSAVRTGPRKVARVATLARTVRKGPAGRLGYRGLVRRPGEPHLVRAELGVRARAGRARRRRGLLAFVQLSDVHVVDVQSPLRVEWTDRFDDPSPVPTATGIFASAYRPHEMLSAQVADAMVREVNRVGRGPVTGRRLALAIQTGDNSDNSQLNEVRWNIDLLDGGRVRPDSGDLRRFEGVADRDPLYYDRSYWHPDPPPPGRAPDLAKTRYGFPTVPGLLDAARRPFRAQGLRMPWYACFGNHDGLVQGNFPAATLPIGAIATGALKVVSPPAGLSPLAVLTALAAGDLAGLVATLSATPGARLVTPDRARRLLSRAETVAQHFTTTGLPRGHGFTAANRRDGTAYYTFVERGCRFVVLDTVNPNGYADGSIDAGQMAWLRRVLAGARSQGQVTMVFSHHTSATMGNVLVGTGADVEPRVTGAEVLALLLQQPHVVAWVNGHTHRNAVTAHRRPGAGRTGGLWEVNTASHIDWPQQSRIIEVVDNRDGTLSLFTTMVDHAGPLRSRDTRTTTGLAGLARELAANDWQDRSDRGLGTRRDRNVELLVRDPRPRRGR